LAAYCLELIKADTWVVILQLSHHQKVQIFQRHQRGLRQAEIDFLRPCFKSKLFIQVLPNRGLSFDFKSAQNWLGRELEILIIFQIWLAINQI